MSTIKSSAENLTLNADGANNDVIIQSNGSTLVTVDGSATNVGIGTTTPAQKLSLNTGYVQVGNGIGGGGGVKYPYSAANADCRNWRTRSDMQEYGDWGIEQSTTQSGETYSFKFKITQAGDAIVNTGDLIFGTANKGIVLGATTNVDANTLDDYEEGDWTPISATGSISSTKYGRYTKVGNLVTVWCQAYDLATDGGSGGFGITGLPFTSSTSQGRAIGSVMMNGIELFDTTAGGLNTYLSDNSTSVEFYQSRKGSTWKQVLNSYISSGDDLMFTFSYRTNS